MSNQEKVQHDYRLHGDSMQEIYPPDYAEWLDKQESTEEDKDKMAEMLSPECDKELF